MDGKKEAVLQLLEKVNGKERSLQWFVYLFFLIVEFLKLIYIC
jgi:hypothetical protein